MDHKPADDGWEFIGFTLILMSLSRSAINDHRITSVRNVGVCFGLETLLTAYLLIALLVGREKHCESGTPRSGNVATIIEGAAWPITLLIDAVQRK
jgi:hypothetical protein